MCIDIKQAYKMNLHPAYFILDPVHIHVIVCVCVWINAFI